MGNKRDCIDEIVSKRERLLSPGTRLLHFAKRTAPIDAGAQFLVCMTESKAWVSEMLKYLPIGYVAAVEAYFRLSFRDLINFGSPFRENAKELRDIKFPIESVLAITGKKISVGEFIAHLLPLNGLADINQSMSILLGEDFLRRLRTTKLSVVQGSEHLTLEDLRSDCFGCVQRMFEFRHLFCHEFAVHKNVEPKTLWDCTRAAFVFVLATESLLNEIKVLSLMGENKEP